MIIFITMILFILYDHHHDHNNMGTEKIWQIHVLANI